MAEIDPFAPDGATIISPGARIGTISAPGMGRDSAKLSPRRGGGGRRDRQTFFRGRHRRSSFPFRFRSPPSPSCAGSCSRSRSSLPAFVGLTTGSWAHQTGRLDCRGDPSSAPSPLARPSASVSLLRFFVLWVEASSHVCLRRPARRALHATHGIVKHIMPSETWRSRLFRHRRDRGRHNGVRVRVMSMAAPGSRGQCVVNA